jgi:hypothetical protein
MYGKQTCRLWNQLRPNHIVLSILLFVTDREKSRHFHASISRIETLPPVLRLGKVAFSEINVPTLIYRYCWNSAVSTIFYKSTHHPGKKNKGMSDFKLLKNYLLSMYA